MCEKRARVRIIETGLREVPAAGPKLRGTVDSAHFLQRFIGNRDREHFVVLQVNAKQEVLSAEVVAIGTLDASPVHPREVFKAAIIGNAAGIICGHNHPSGDASPSPEDYGVFSRLQQAGNLLGIPVIDFLVVSRDSHKSLMHE